MGIQLRWCILVGIVHYKFNENPWWVSAATGDAVPPPGAWHKLRKKDTIHQVTTMLATSKNVLFSGHNHPTNHRYCWPDTLILAWTLASHQYRWLAGWLWPGNRTFLKVASMVVSWWIAFSVFFLLRDKLRTIHSSKGKMRKQYYFTRATKLWWCCWSSDVTIIIYYVDMLIYP